MSNIELVSYKEYPSDPYTKALCTVCIDGKYNVTYGKKLSKEGKSWWQSASFSVSDQGAKEFVDGFALDSNKENAKILDFVKQCASSKGGAQASISDLMQEVANNEALPF